MFARSNEQIFMSEKHYKREYIDIIGAREHNLQNIDVKIPRNELVVFTGISGSGKSSLAFDTIYAEGQRRYMESFSAYARSFIGNMERPDVDKIDGLSPVISIEQKTVSKNPRSTVGTTTEIYDFMRLLFARASDAYSYVTGEQMIRQSEDQIINGILQEYEGKVIAVLAPVVKGRKGHYRELFTQIRKKGFLRCRVDGEIQEIVPRMQLDRYKTHDVEIVIDRLEVEKEDRYRLTESIRHALREGKGILQILGPDDHTRSFSKFLMCPTSGISYEEPAPNSFSFNSPYGACETCKGLGAIEEFTLDSIAPDKRLSISQGGFAPIGDYRSVWIFKELEKFLKSEKVKITTPIQEIPDSTMEGLLYGGPYEYRSTSATGRSMTYNGQFKGVIPYLEEMAEMQADKKAQSITDYMGHKTCPDCNGMRLKKESLHFKVDKKNISELAQLDIIKLGNWFENLEERLSKKQLKIASEVLKEIRKRIRFLLDVGLEYLTLDRSLKTLSGGEAQRIRLATQIGTQLMGVTYILDEPSIGLHQRDNARLINSLKGLRDLGNTVLVVEHDKDMMLASDYIVDIGPGAGKRGGKIVAAGDPQSFLDQGSVTAKFLKGDENIDVPATRRKGNGKTLSVKGAIGHNLKDVTLNLPLAKLICVTGVSGSGKSSMIHGTLYPMLSKHFYRSRKDPLPYTAIEGLKEIDKVIEVDQSPIGRTPRSNPATYTGVFSDIRTLFTQLPEAKIRGYKPGRFSFNVKGGRCETCQGAGLKVIEMDFLPSVHVPCETCRGKRYNRETLEVRFKGKSISDVLDMSVDEAVNFFSNQPRILRRIETLKSVGLGYITLGQHATTLSGGEAQRVKLATELAKRDTGKTFYILDEPTTGLHFEDIRLLLDVLQKLVDKGNSVLIIEHNMDVIKVADHIVDMGPEGGDSGGYIIAEGTPEEIVKQNKGYTSKFLKEEL